MRNYHYQALYVHKMGAYKRYTFRMIMIIIVNTPTVRIENMFLLKLHWVTLARFTLQFAHVRMAQASLQRF